VKLHHVGILIRDIAKTAELYNRRFGYQCITDIIHDPMQGTYVQFLEMRGDPVYLEFIAPDSPASHLMNALKKGGGVHHVCFAVADIDAACAHLRSNGMSLVRAPASAPAFRGRRIAWLMAQDRALTELVEEGPAGEI
jgi:methylmalonyl-CoA/ethylmalonyl-CoA epimerase